MNDEILIGGALGGKLVPKAVLEKVEEAHEELAKHIEDPWKRMFALGEVMIRMGFQPGNEGCTHLDFKGHCEYCLQSRVKRAEFALKAEYALYFRDAVLALHNPERYGEENVKKLIRLLEEKAHLCQDMREIVEFGKVTQGEFMLRHGIPQEITK